MWFWLGGTVQGAASDESAELLARFRKITRRPTNDRDLTTADIYMYLTDAQRHLFHTFAAHIPEVLKGAPQLMVTDDGGLTYALPNNEEGLGHLEVYPRWGATEPLTEGPLWDDRADYTREGPRKIRMAGNRARTFASGPYARYALKPGVIDNSKQPTLQPADARGLLIPWQAAELWASAPGARHDPTPYRQMVNKLLWGDAELPGDPGLIGAYKLSHFGSGGLSSLAGSLWWRGQDLGRVG